MKDYYKILGVARTASNKQVKSAYFELARKTHPDKHGAENHDAMAELATAKEILLDEKTRAKYDAILSLYEMDFTNVANFTSQMRALGNTDLVDIHSQFCGDVASQVSIDKRLLVAFGHDLRLFIKNNEKESIDEQHKSLGVFFTNFGQVGGVHMFSLCSLLSHMKINGITITNKLLTICDDLYQSFEKVISTSSDYNATRAVCRDIMQNAARLTPTTFPSMAPAPTPLHVPAPTPLHTPTPTGGDNDTGIGGIALAIKSLGYLAIGVVLASCAVGIMTAIAYESIIIGGLAAIASAAVLLGYSSSFGPASVCVAMGVMTALATNSLLLGIVAGVGMAAAMVCAVVIGAKVLASSVAELNDSIPSTSY